MTTGYRAEDRSLGLAGRRRVRFWSPPVTSSPRRAWAGPFSGLGSHLLDRGHLCHPRTRKQSRCFWQWTVHGTVPCNSEPGTEEEPGEASRCLSL